MNNMKNQYLVLMVLVGFVLSFFNAVTDNSDIVYAIAGIMMFVSSIWCGVRLLKSGTEAEKVASGFSFLALVGVALTDSDTSASTLFILLWIASDGYMAYQLWNRD
jgi:hypothetical protein